MNKKVSNGGDKSIKVEVKVWKKLMLKKVETDIPIKYIIRNLVMDGTLTKEK